MDFKVLGLIIVYNEEEFIYYALKNIADFCDEIVIVDGAVDWVYEIEGHKYSYDNTHKEIHRFEKDTGKKVRIFKKQAKDKIEMKNFGLSKRSIDPDILFAHDGDEVYKKRELKDLLNFAHNCNHKMIKFPFIHFWRDFWHVAKGGRWNARHSRIFKFRPGYRFSSRHHLELTDEIGNELANDAVWIRKDTIKSKPHCYHYGHCQPPSKRLSKLIYYRKREKNKESIKKNEEWIRKHDPYFMWTEAHSKNKKLLRYKDEMFLPFRGSHPRIMKEHPLYTGRD